MSTSSVPESTRMYLKRLNKLISKFNTVIDTECGLEARVQPIPDIDDSDWTKSEMAEEVRDRHAAVSSVAGIARDTVDADDPVRDTVDEWAQDLDSIFLFLISILDPPTVHEAIGDDN